MALNKRKCHLLTSESEQLTAVGKMGSLQLLLFDRLRT